MTHTVRDKRKLLARVRRVRGQVEAVERALEGEAECEQVMHLIAGIRGSMASLMAEVVEDHVRAHFVVGPGMGQGGDQGSPEAGDGGGAVEQLVEVVRAYLK